MSRRSTSGQATVELALLLPFILVMVLAVAQIALIWRDQILVTQVAREAARAAVVTADPAAITRAGQSATSLEPESLQVHVVRRGHPGETVTVRVTYDVASGFAIIGRLAGGLTLSASATMLVES